MDDYTEDELEALASMPPEMRWEYERSRNLFHHVNRLERQPKFLIDGFLPLGYCCILAGDPKAGKTALASAIAMAVAEGSPFAAMESVRSGVLWLALEESPEERATIMAPVFDRLDDTTFYVTHQKIAIDTPEGLSDLQEWVSLTEAKLIVVDPLHAAHSGRSLDDGWRARRTLAPFKKFCYDKDLTGLVLHHISRTGNRVAENSQLAACAGMSLLYTSQQTADGRVVRLHGAGRGDFANRIWHFGSNGPLNYWPTQPPAAETKADGPPKYLLDDLVYQYLEHSTEPCCASDIAGGLQRNPNSVRNAIARLIALDRIKQTYTFSGSRHYDIHRDIPHMPSRFATPPV
ncbi:MAG: AAA family ATPase [Armatimonadota bacterium]|nr:AAA family ATPase [Armatimonadota bacterium]